MLTSPKFAINFPAITSIQKYLVTLLFEKAEKQKSPDTDELNAQQIFLLDFFREIHSNNPGIAEVSTNKQFLGYWINHYGFLARITKNTQPKWFFPVFNPKSQKVDQFVFSIRWKSNNLLELEKGYKFRNLKPIQYTYPFELFKCTERQAVPQTIQRKEDVHEIPPGKGNKTRVRPRGKPKQASPNQEAITANLDLDLDSNTPSDKENKPTTTTTTTLATSITTTTTTIQQPPATPTPSPAPPTRSPSNIGTVKSQKPAKEPAPKNTAPKPQITSGSPTVDVHSEIAANTLIIKIQHPRKMFDEISPCRFKFYGSVANLFSLNIEPMENFFKRIQTKRVFYQEPL